MIESLALPLSVLILAAFGFAGFVLWLRHSAEARQSTLTFHATVPEVVEKKLGDLHLRLQKLETIQAVSPVSRAIRGIPG